MNMFEDIGFDLLPKNPVPGNTLNTIQPIEPPPVFPPAVSPLAGVTPDPTPPKKGSSALGWILFGLFLLGSAGMTIYMAKKDRSYKKKREN